MSVKPYKMILNDFKPDQLFEHYPPKTITESDNNLFCLLTTNHHPIHSDIEFARKALILKPLHLALDKLLNASINNHKELSNSSDNFLSILKEFSSHALKPSISICVRGPNWRVKFPGDSVAN